MCLGKMFEVVYTSARGPMVVHLVTLLPCNKKVSCIRLPAGGLHVLPVHAWVFTGCSGFLPQSHMPVRLVGLSKLPLGICMVVCVLPCNGLATCPGCILPPAHRLLEIGSSFPVNHYGRSGIEDD
ncbi:hypothetical protein CHARACLAT_023624 [Characodon lateralis]|uniref:Uncharacterized protein n=1 Tax=Characodon lateralis TaxID=208331 RepID=A0ABU7F5U5_9TELE|nr:hypothetical protein [Characodon lateralis]